MQRRIIFLLPFLILTGDVCSAQDLIVLESQDTIQARDIEITRNYINYTMFFDRVADIYSFERKNVAKIIFSDGRVGTNKNNYHASVLDYPQVLRLEHISSGELILFRPGDYLSIKAVGARKRALGEITAITTEGFYLENEFFAWDKVVKIGQYIPNPRLRVAAGGLLVGSGVVAAGVGVLGIYLGFPNINSANGIKLFGGGLLVAGIGATMITVGMGWIIQSTMAKLDKGKWEIITDL